MLRPVVNAKLSCHACNLVNQSAGHAACVQTSGESTLQIVNKRLPRKTLRRNDQASANRCEGLNSKCSCCFFEGRKGAAHYGVLLCERFFHSRDKQSPYGWLDCNRVRWSAQARAWADSDTRGVAAPTSVLSGQGFCAEGEVECLTNRMTS